MARRLLSRGLFDVSVEEFSGWITRDEFEMINNPRDVLLLLGNQIRKAADIPDKEDIGLLVHIDEYHLMAAAFTPRFVKVRETQ